MNVSLSQIDLRDDPKTLARLLYMKEKPLTYEHGVKLAKAVRSHLNCVFKDGYAVQGFALNCRVFRIFVFSFFLCSR